MKQDIQKQYDDDLTLGADEYDDSYYTDADDLFELSTDNESPISRLKSLVLSIDWEITDEVLLQFNEELVDLKGIWAGNSINLVYVQALEKLSKYIYQNKANSHPNAIKLLLTLYYNLEKIESSADLSESEKKEILVEDVKRFEALKRQISQKTKQAPSPAPAPAPEALPKKQAAPEDVLLNLRAIVLGIDWEITDQDLNNLRREVFQLEERYAASKPKLILLQGIGTIGAYIKTKKSNAHADAFKVLHLFYECLEKLVKTPMSLEEEKAILFPAVGKFNEFKALLGATISSETIDRDEDEEEDEEYEESGSGQISPALADASDEEIGFQAEEEAKSLGLDNTEGVSSHLDNFFGERFSSPAAEETRGLTDAFQTEKTAALQGVDVEADDEEEDSADYTPGVAALADANDGEVSEYQDHSAGTAGTESAIASATDSLFPDTEVPPRSGYAGIDKEVALQGVNVETEADEDSDEIALPMEGERVAPALVSSQEESLFSAKTLETNGPGDISEEISGTLDDLFLEEQVPDFVPLETAVHEGLMADSPEEGPAKAVGEHSPAEAGPAVEPEVFEGTAPDGQPASEAARSEERPDATQEEGELDIFFTGEDAEQSVEESAAVDALFENLDEQSAQADQELAVAEAEAPAVADDGSVPAEEDMWIAEALSPDVEPVDAAIAADAVEHDLSLTPTPAEKEEAEEEVVFDLVEGEAEPVAQIAEELAFTDEVTELTEPAVVEDAPTLDAMEFAGSTTEVSDDPLTGLRGCIESLGIELNDKIIDGLFDEINQLSQKWSSRPLEKTFLQLLSTITQHIDHRRFEASSEAHGLLHSVYAALAARREDDMLHNQELLLVETSKVLEWQQALLTRQAAQIPEATATAPVWTEAEEAGADDVDSGAQELEVTGSAADEPFAKKIEAQLGPARELLAAELKQEIDTLRKTLQQEIAELRSEMKSR